MSDDIKPQSDSQRETPPASDADSPAVSGRLRAVATRLRDAAFYHWKRSLAILGTIGLLIAGIAVAWTYTAQMAIDAERARLDEAFAALDAGDYERAAVLVRQVLNSGALPRREYGGPLFVLGAVRAHDAGLDEIVERRRTEYLIASRYLKEAQAFGFAPDREKQGLLLLGMSFVASYQTADGIDALTRALAARSPHAENNEVLDRTIHRLLAEAYLQLPKPKLELALHHADAMLADETLPPAERVVGLILKAKILARLKRYEESREAVMSVAQEATDDPGVLLARGQLMLDAVEATRDELPPTSDGKLPPELLPQVEQAVALLSQAQSRAGEATEIVRRSLYLLGRAAELRGDRQEALRMYGETHQHYGDTPEGLAAKLAEADISRRTGDDQTALIWYRQVLQGDVDPTSYRSEVLPIDQLRTRILAAINDFVARSQFDSAMAMLDRLTPLFSRAQVLALRGRIFRDWGNRQLDQASDDLQHGDALRRAGLRQLRMAGVAFERLAELRFATPYYTDGLWESADCYFRGQSYTNAARVLDLYLQHEPEKRNAQALLRLGQSNLALGRVDACIAALEECIELYEHDIATYQARIDCAKAYWYQGHAEEAERLLRFNLTESTLQPRSPEWKDSLFALGTLLFEQGRHEEAISTLEEAVERYPDDRQTLQARYLVGEAYRRWAVEPLARLQQSRTSSEREKNQQLVDERLARALANFKDVQSRITLQVHNVQDDPMYAAMRRNCYMLEGAVLFDLGRYSQAIEAYQNVSSLYPNEPFVLETFVQIAHCWQRMNRPENAHGAIDQARLTLEQLPRDADFLATTNFSREEWRLLLADMSQW